MIFEIQQNSDTTYRVFDWNRTGLDGKPDSAVFEHILGVRPKTLTPSTYLSDELLALKQTTGSYTITADNPALPPKGTVLPCVNGMMTVTPVAPDVKVLATFNGEPCITVRDRAMFIGSRLGVDIAMVCPMSWKHTDEQHQISFSSVPEPIFQNVLKVLHGFADVSGASPLAEVTADGHRPLNLFSGVMENPALDAHLIVLGNYETVERDYTVRFPACLANKGTGQQYDVYELKTNKWLAHNTNGELTVFVPNGGVRMLLVAPKAVIDKIAPIQRQVQQQSQLYDFLCGKLFFCRLHPDDLPWEIWRQTAYGANAYTDLGAMVEPNCMIVLPDKPATEDEVIAQYLQQRIYRWPLGKSPLLLPIKRASEVTLYDRDRYNLLLIGGPRSNRVTAQYQSMNLLTVRNPKVGIGFLSRRHWKDGGNIVALMGESPKARQQQYAAFQAYLNTWFTAGYYAGSGYRPKDQWIADIKDELAPQGWTFSTDSVCDLVARRKDGKVVNIFMQEAMTTPEEEALTTHLKSYQERGASVMLLTPNLRWYSVLTDGEIIAKAADGGK